MTGVIVVVMVSTAATIMIVIRVASIGTIAEAIEVTTNMIDVIVEVTKGETGVQQYCILAMMLCKVMFENYLKCHI